MLDHRSAAIFKTSSQRKLGSILLSTFVPGSKIKIGPSLRWDDGIGAEAA